MMLGWIDKIALEKNERAGEVTSLDIKIYQVIVIDSV